MKQRANKNGCDNNNWATPQHVLNYISTTFFNGEEFFDPCPLGMRFEDGKMRNGLEMNWAEYNFINPPYSRKLKEQFIKKAFEESKQNKICVMLLPVSTETQIFHDIIVPNAEVIFIKQRICFTGFNSKGAYVTNSAGQSGSMLVIFGKNHKRNISTIEFK